MTDLSLQSADTLGITLYRLDGALTGHEVRKLSLGPWKLDLDVQATSDVLSKQEHSFWLTIEKKLHLYVVVRPHEGWLIVLDTVALKKCGKKTGFAGATVAERAEEFKTAIRAMFRWHDGKWSQLPLETNAWVN